MSINGEEYFIEPLQAPDKKTEGHPHLIYKRSALNKAPSVIESTNIRGTGTCGNDGKYITHKVVSYIENPIVVRMYRIRTCQDHLRIDFVFYLSAGWPLYFYYIHRCHRISNEMGGAT